MKPTKQQGWPAASATPISLSALQPPIPGPCPARGSTTTNGRLRWSITIPSGVDGHEAVFDRPGERATVDHELAFEGEHVRDRLGHVLEVLVAALAQHVEEQHRALGGVDPGLAPGPEPAAPGLRERTCGAGRVGADGLPAIARDTLHPPHGLNR